MTNWQKWLEALVISVVLLMFSALLVTLVTVLLGLAIAMGWGWLWASVGLATAFAICILLARIIKHSMD